MRGLRRCIRVESGFKTRHLRGSTLKSPPRTVQSKFSVAAVARNDAQDHPVSPQLTAAESAPARASGTVPTRPRRPAQLATRAARRRRGHATAEAQAQAHCIQQQQQSDGSRRRPLEAIPPANAVKVSLINASLEQPPATHTHTHTHPRCAAVPHTHTHDQRGGAPWLFTNVQAHDCLCLNPPHRCGCEGVGV